MMGQIEASPALKIQPAKNQHQPPDQEKTDEERTEKQEQIIEQIEKKKTNLQSQKKTTKKEIPLKAKVVSSPQRTLCFKSKLCIISVLTMILSTDLFSGSRIIGSEWGGWKVKEAKPTEAGRPGDL